MATTRIKAVQTMIKEWRASLRELERALEEEEGREQERVKAPEDGPKRRKGTKGRQPEEEKAEAVVPTPSPVAKVGGCGSAGQMRAGARVMVKVRDQYYGRYGTILCKKGNYFWDIKLDAAAEQPACVIYKKGTSLMVVG
jgi:hypothetical protein